MRQFASMFLVFLLSLGCPLAQADTLKVLTTGAYKGVLMALVPDFEARTGHKLEVLNDTAGALTRRIGAGETFDVLVLTPGGLKAPGEKGKVLPDSITPLARAAIGVAVRAGADAPAIGTVEEFRLAVLNAKKVAYIDPAAGGSSGIYLDGLFQRMGLAQAVRAKAVLVPGGLVATRLVSGEADLAIHQISEILPVQGAQLVGPLPEAIQNYTTYAGAISPNAANPQAARELLATLSGAQAQQILRTKGMLAPR